LSYLPRPIRAMVAIYRVFTLQFYWRRREKRNVELSRTNRAGLFLNMSLDEAHFDPFDATYEIVTGQILEFARSLQPADHRWLLSLVNEFTLERRKWNTESELEPYRREWSRLNSGFMRLVAGAYLHIAYDLPRVIADHWPGRPPWLDSDEMQGEKIFFELDDYFPNVFATVAKQRRVFGFPSFGLRFFSNRLLASVAHWVAWLRSAAWRHGKFLALETTPFDRGRREQAMLRAVTAALRDVSDLRPWTAGLLKPPKSFSLKAVGPLLLLEDGHFWIGSLATLIFVAIGSTVLWRRARVLGDFQLFSNELARRTAEYVDVAIRDPEAFDDYRIRRAPSSRDARPSV
jgi:hypothetical protein